MRDVRTKAQRSLPTPKSRFRTEWAEAFCLRCGKSVPLMLCIASKPLSKESWLSKIPKTVVRKLQALNDDHQFFRGACPTCRTPFCVAVESMVMPLRRGGFVVRFRGEWCRIGKPTRGSLGPRLVRVSVR